MLYILISFLFLLLSWPLRRSSKQPLIFIPGSSAGQERFNWTIWRLGGKKPTKLTVFPDGTYDICGQSKDFIVVGFKDNRDRLGTIEADANLLLSLLPKLQRSMDFKSFHAVGHSNGGLIWVRYLQLVDSTGMRSLTTLASPFDLEGFSLDPVTHNLTVYNLTGSHDLLVRPSSVEGAAQVFPNQEYKAKIFKGLLTGHSHLPQHPAVVKHLKNRMKD